MRDRATVEAEISAAEGRLYALRIELTVATGYRWDPADESLLKADWEAGKPTRQIMLDHEVTRNQVLGLVFRGAWKRPQPANALKPAQYREFRRLRNRLPKYRLPRDQAYQRALAVQDVHA